MGNKNDGFASHYFLLIDILCKYSSRYLTSNQS